MHQGLEPEPERLNQPNSNCPRLVEIVTGITLCSPRCPPGSSALGYTPLGSFRRKENRPALLPATGSLFNSQQIKHSGQLL